MFTINHGCFHGIPLQIKATRKMGESQVIPITFSVLYALTMLASVLGNALLIYIVWQKPEVRSLTSFMFVNMAVADLLVTLVMMPWSIAHFHTESEWQITGILGEITCRAVVYTANVTVMASILCLVFMAIDRYYAVIRPLNRRSLWFRKAKLVSPVVWIMSMVLMSAWLVFFDLQRQSCGYNFSLFGITYKERIIRGFFVYIFLATYVFPLIVISVLYAKVAHKIWFHKAPGNQLVEVHQQQEITKKRVIRMLIIIVVVFALCWLPAQAYHLFLAITAWQVHAPDFVMYLVFWLGHANSAINPWLYIRLSSRIKSAFTRMVSRRINGESKTYSQRTKSTRAALLNKQCAETRL